MLLKLGLSVGESSFKFWLVKMDLVVVDVESPITADSFIILEGFCLHQAEDDWGDVGDMVEVEVDEGDN